MYDKEIYGLTAIKSGKFQIGKTKFISGDSLRFNSLQETVDTTPATVTVLDLPPNKPKDFTGAIGNFKLNLSNFPKNIHRGETAYFEITIEGEGGYEGITPIPQSDRKIQLISQNKSKTFRKLESGEYGFYSVVQFLYGCQIESLSKLQLTPFQFSFFSLKENQYKTLSIQFPEIAILPEKKRETENPPTKANLPKPPSIFLLVFLAVLGVLSFLGYKRYTYNRQSEEFLDMVQNFGKKRNVFLADYLEKKEISKEDSQFLVDLLGNFDIQTIEKTFHNLSKSERNKVLSLKKQLKIKE